MNKRSKSRRVSQKIRDIYVNVLVLKNKVWVPPTGRIFDLNPLAECAISVDGKNKKGAYFGRTIWLYGNPKIKS